MKAQMDLPSANSSQFSFSCKMSAISFKNPLCLSSRSPANKFCVNPTCTKNAFCCKHCLDQQCENNHLHGGKLELRKWALTAPELEKVTKEADCAWPEEKYFDKVVDETISELLGVLKAYRTFVAHKKQSLSMKPEFKTVINKLQQQNTYAITGTDMHNLIQSIESGSCYSNKQAVESDISKKHQKMDNLMKKIRQSLTEYKGNSELQLKSTIPLSSSTSLPKPVQTPPPNPVLPFTIVHSAPTIVPPPPPPAPVPQNEIQNLMKSSNWKLAIQKLNTVVKDNISDVSAYNSRGLCHYNIKNLQAAIEDFTKAINLSKCNHECYLNRAKCHTQLKNFQQAIKDYSQAIKYNPDNPQCYNSRGQIYHRVKQHRLAMQDFNSAITRSPSKADFFNNRASTYESLRDFRSAVGDLTKAIQLNSTNALYYNNRGYNYQNLSMFNEAVEDYRKAIRLQPRKSLFYNNLGFCYDLMKDHKNAVEEYTRAIDLDQNPAYYTNRAHSYEKLGKLLEAESDKSRARICQKYGSIQL